MRSKSAITLVALIITIIILLVLATVSISLVINNGVLDKAQNGVDKYSEEEELEQIKLAVASAMLRGNGFLDTDNLNGELHERIDENENAEKRENTWYYKEYIIDESGKVEKQDRLLPREFKQVEYIESTGTQWINTKIIPDSNTIVETHIYRTTRNKTWQFPFGARNTAGTNEFEMCFYKDGGGWRDDFGNTADRIFFNYTTEIGDFYIYKNKNTSKINNITVSHSDTININCLYEFTIFGVNYQGGIRTLETDMLKLYYFKIYSNNKCLRDFIPCYCTTTVTNVDGDECDSGTIGLYDMVEGKIYTNKGSGTFLKGNNV